MTEDKWRHLEDINQKLSTDLELTHAADREKARLLEQLQAENTTLKQQTSQVTCCSKPRVCYLKHLCYRSGQFWT